MDLQEFLNEGDRFAATNGMQLTEVREGYARAEMTVEARHLNAAGVCQGGAYFTLADLAFAAVTNYQGIITLGIQNSITFLQSAHEGYHHEAANHCHGTAVDGIHQCIAEHHVHYGQSHAPYEASPYGKTCDALPVEAQHERGKEGTGEGSP